MMLVQNLDKPAALRRRVSPDSEHIIQVSPLDERFLGALGQHRKLPVRHVDIGVRGSEPLAHRSPMRLQVNSGVKLKVITPKSQFQTSSRPHPVW